MEGAQGLHRSQSFLGNYFRRMKARLGRAEGVNRRSHTIGTDRLSHGDHASGIR